MASTVNGPLLIYCRKSRALGDPDDPNLLANMRASLLDLLRRDGYDPARVRLIEEVGSGERIRTRPAFLNLLRELERGQLKDGLIGVTELTRLTRGNLADMARVQEALSGARFLVRTRKRLLDLTDEDDLEYYEDETMYGRRELRRIKGRFAAGKAELLRQGRLRSGSHPYGYRYTRDGKTLLVEPGEFAILQALCHDALTLSLRRLSERYGLSPARIWRTLTCPTICGYAARRKGRTEASRDRAYGHIYLPRDQIVWPDEPGAWPPAISREQFDRLQEALQRRFKERAKPGGAAGWCRDVLCFRAAGESPSRVRLGCHRNERTCDLTYEQERPGQPLLYIPRATVHTAVSEALRAVLTDSEAVRERAERYAAERGSPGARDAAAADLAAARAQLAECRRILDELLVRELSAAGPADAASVARVRKDKLTEEARLTVLVQTLERRPPAGPDLAPILGLLPLIAADWEDFWEESLHDEGRRLIVRACLAALEVETVKERGRRAWRREVVAIRFHDWLCV